MTFKLWTRNKNVVDIVCISVSSVFKRKMFFFSFVSYSYSFPYHTPYRSRLYIVQAVCAVFGSGERIICKKWGFPVQFLLKFFSFRFVCIKKNFEKTWGHPIRGLYNAWASEHQADGDSHASMRWWRAIVISGMTRQDIHHPALRAVMRVYLVHERTL